MAEFKCTIELGNDAMQTPEAVADALEQVAARLRGGARSGTIVDDNGNKVGRFEYFED